MFKLVETFLRELGLDSLVAIGTGDFLELSWFFHLVYFKTSVILHIPRPTQPTDPFISPPTSLGHINSIPLSIKKLRFKHFNFRRPVVPRNIAFLTSHRCFVENLAFQRLFSHSNNPFFFHFFVVYMRVYLPKMGVLEVGVYGYWLLVVGRERLPVYDQAFRGGAVLLH